MGVKGGRVFIGEKVVGWAPKQGGAAAHVLAPLPLSFYGYHLYFMLKQRKWVVGGFGRWKKKKNEWRRVGGDVM